MKLTTIRLFVVIFAAINRLQAVINEVEAQSGNQIPVEGATALIATAQQ